jgi:hypothetical protein
MAHSAIGELSFFQDIIATNEDPAGFWNGQRRSIHRKVRSPLLLNSPDVRPSECSFSVGALVFHANESAAHSENEKAKHR